MDRVTGAGDEAVEDEHPRDKPPPPPPPEQPGNGVPSRAETHQAAAALEAEDDQTPAKDKPDTSQQPTDTTTREQAPESAEDRPESPTPQESADSSAKTLAGERDARGNQAERTDTNEDARQDFPSASSDSTPAEPFDRSACQQPSEIETQRTEDTIVDDRPAPTDTVTEAADTQPTTELDGTPDIPGAEPEDFPSRRDSHSAAAVDIERTSEPDAKTAEAPSEQPESTTSTLDTPSTATDVANNPGDAKAEDITATDRLITDATDDAVSQPSGAASAPENLGETEENIAAKRLTTEEVKSFNRDAQLDGSGETAAEVAVPQDFQITVEGKPINAYLDPVGAAARSYETVEDHDPALERIDEGEPPELGEKSRTEKFRTAFRRGSQDYIEGAGKVAKEMQGIMRGAPPGHKVEQSSPEITPAPHYGPDAANIVSTALVTGAMIGEVARWAHMRMRKRGERA